MTKAITKEQFLLLREFDSNMMYEPATRFTTHGRISIGNFSELQYIAGPDASGFVIFLNTHSEFTMIAEDLDIRELPLFWLEGKPVYVGDPVYDRREVWSDIPYIVESIVDNRVVLSRVSTGAMAGRIFSVDISEGVCPTITLETPKKIEERWINIYPVPWKDTSQVAMVRYFKSEEDALRDAESAIATIKISIEV